jgi:TorA maturation chaperone TorD
MTKEELKTIHQGRDVVFNIFSRVFIDVPGGSLDEMLKATAVYFQEMSEDTDNLDMVRGAELLREFFASEDEESVLNRNRDYTRLYVLGKGSVPIYESVYTSPEHMMKQDSWADVKALYFKNFFKRTDDEHTSEDHISMELQFMGLLSKRLAELTENGDFDSAKDVLKVQLDFYDNHIFKWIPLFCDLTIGKQPNTCTPFYPAFAMLLKGFITEDRAFLESLEV